VLITKYRSGSSYNAVSDPSLPSLRSRNVRIGNDQLTLLVSLRVGNQAVRGDKTIATVAWLYEVCLTKKWVDPKLHLLHYPLPDDTIPVFAGFVSRRSPSFSRSTSFF